MPNKDPALHKEALAAGWSLDKIQRTRDSDIRHALEQPAVAIIKLRPVLPPQKIEVIEPEPYVHKHSPYGTTYTPYTPPPTPTRHVHFAVATTPSPPSKPSLEQLVAKSQTIKGRMHQKTKLLDDHRGSVPHDEIVRLEQSIYRDEARLHRCESELLAMVGRMQAHLQFYGRLIGTLDSPDADLEDRAFRDATVAKHETLTRTIQYMQQTANTWNDGLP